MKIRVIFSGVMFGLFISHLIFPSLKIDTTLIVLIILVFAPWLIDIFQTMELPGGFKFTFRKLEEVSKKLEESGLISNETNNNENKYTFQSIGSNDPNLALAGLRIEIEKKLKNLAEQNGIGASYQGIGRLLQVLSNHHLIGIKERSILYDMIQLLNAAVHGATIDYNAYTWAMEFGPKLLNALDERKGQK